jgi:aldose 1-epimerase
LGRREPVGLGADFRTPGRLGERLPGVFKGHGDLYFVNRAPNERGTLVPAARVRDPASGRVMNVFTTADCVQLYSGISLDGSLRGKGGATYGRHQGFCLECEGYPDGANRPELGDILVHPGRVKQETTLYAFSASEFDRR